MKNLKKIKPFFWSLMFLFIYIQPIIANSASKDVDKILGKLAQKELNIKSYYGLKVDGFIIERLPFIKISRVAVIKDGNVVKTQDIVFISPKISRAVREGETQRIETLLKNFNPTDVNIIDRENDDHLTALEFNDSTEGLKEIKYIDPESGFAVKHVYYGRNEKLISFDFFLKLEINQPLPNMSDAGKIKHINFEKLKAKHADFLPDNLSSIEKIVNEVINDNIR